MKRRAEPFVDPAKDRAEVGDDVIEQADHEPASVREEGGVEARIAPQGLAQRDVALLQGVLQHAILRPADQDQGRDAPSDGREHLGGSVNMMGDARPVGALGPGEGGHRERVGGPGEPLDHDLGVRSGDHAVPARPGDGERDRRML